METIKGPGLENQQERLATTVSHLLEMVNHPDRMGKELEAIIKGLGAPQLPEDAQKSMDQIVDRVRSILPKEDGSISKEEIENMVRAILEDSHI